MAIGEPSVIADSFDDIEETTNTIAIDGDDFEEFTDLKSNTSISNFDNQENCDQ